MLGPLSTFEAGIKVEGPPRRAVPLLAGVAGSAARDAQEDKLPTFTLVDPIGIRVLPN